MPVDKIPDGVWGGTGSSKWEYLAPPKFLSLAVCWCGRRAFGPRLAISLLVYYTHTWYHWARTPPMRDISLGWAWASPTLMWSIGKHDPTDQLSNWSCVSQSHAYLFQSHAHLSQSQACQIRNRQHNVHGRLHMRRSTIHVLRQVLLHSCRPQSAEDNRSMTDSQVCSDIAFCNVA